MSTYKCCALPRNTPRHGAKTKELNEEASRPSNLPPAINLDVGSVTLPLLEYMREFLYASSSPTMESTEIEITMITDSIVRVLLVAHKPF